MAQGPVWYRPRSVSPPAERQTAVARPPFSLPARILLILLVLFLPLVHSGSIADPFGLPKEALLHESAALLLLFALFGAGRGTARNTRPLALVAAAVVLLAAAGVATLVSANPRLAAEGWLNLAGLAIVAVAVARFVRTPGDALLLQGAALSGACLASLAALAQIFSPGFNWSIGSVSIVPPSPGGGTLGDPGLAAQFVLVAVPLGLGAAAIASGIARLVCAAGLGILASLLLYAGRPEGWLVALWVVVLLAAIRLARATRAGSGWIDLTPDLGGGAVRGLLIIATVVILAVAVGRLPRPGGQPVAPLASVSLLAPTTGDVDKDRRAGTEGSGALLRLHPLGVGPGYFRHAFLEVAWTRVKESPFTLGHQAVHAGNSWLEAFAEYGLAGGLGLVAVMLLLLLQAARAALVDPGPWGTVGATAGGTILASGVIALYGSPFQEITPALMIALAAGLCIAAARGARDTASAGEERAPGRAPLPLRLAAFFLGIGCVAGGMALAATRYEASHLTLVAQALNGSGDFRGTERVLSQPAALRSPEHLPHVLLGQAALRNGAYSDASAAFGDTLRVSPWFIAARLGRAAAEEALGHYDKAADDLDAARRVWPQSYDVVMAQGRLDVRRGRLEQAATEFEEASKIDPSLGDSWFALGELYARRGDWDRAIESFHMVLEKNPRYPHINLKLGDGYEHRGMMEMAIGHMQREALFDERNPEPRLRMANIFHAQGQECEARQALEAARDLETDPQRRQVILDLIGKEDTLCRQITERKNRHR
jgi:tetratricopeptide (TPR) repeat protein